MKLYNVISSPVGVDFIGLHNVLSAGGPAAPQLPGITKNPVHWGRRPFPRLQTRTRSTVNTANSQELSLVPTKLSLFQTLSESIFHEMHNVFFVRIFSSVIYCPFMSTHFTKNFPFFRA